MAMNYILADFFGPEYSVWQIIQHYWMILPISFLVSLAATPLCRLLALRWKVIDMPNATVKTHKQPTAYLGGVGILAGLLTGLAIGFWLLKYKYPELNEMDHKSGSFSGSFPNWLMLFGIGFGAIVSCLVGVLDDIIDLKPLQKLTGQVLAAVILVVVGIRPNLPQIFRYLDMDVDPSLVLLLKIPIVLFFILGATNSLNLLDGLDALCAGVTTVITLAFLLLTVHLATWGYSPIGDPVRLIVCLALVGGTLGFLPLNRHPAKIFMGDAGSMLLGFVAGTMMILFMETIGRWSVAAVVIFGLPILDTAVAMVRRFLNKQPLFVSDRGHIYDQLVDHGWGVQKTVKVCYYIAAIYAMAGLVLAQIRFRYAILSFILIGILSAVTICRCGFLQIPKKTETEV